MICLSDIKLIKNVSAFCFKFTILFHLTAVMMIVYYNIVIPNIILVLT